MPAGVGVLGAEGGAERIDLRQREAVRLDVQLSGDGEEGLAPEEVLREVDPALGCAGQIHQVQRGDAKQFPRPLRVRRRDDGCVHPDEAVVVKEAMDRLGDGVAHTRHRADHVRARPQMGDLAQELERVRLRLNGIGVGVLDPADHFDRAGLHFERLPLGGRWHDGAGGFHRASGGQTQHLIRVVGKRVGRHHLDRMEAGAVGHVDEGDAGLRIAPRAHPALDGDGRVLRRPARENLCTGKGSHLKPHSREALIYSHMRDRFPKSTKRR